MQIHFISQHEHVVSVMTAQPAVKEAKTSLWLSGCVAL